MSDSRRQRRPVAPVNVGRSFELVLNALRRGIESGELAPEDPLPAERALAKGLASPARCCAKR